MSKKRSEKMASGCPVGTFFESINAIFGDGSDIGRHLQRSQLELLKAVRTWADGRIEQLEEYHSAKHPKKATKIKVE
jgi:hypothetical protein